MRTKKERNGLHTHEGVIVVYDEDYDERVLDLLDLLDTTGLLVASERKGMLRLTWQDNIPEYYRDRTDMQAPDGDSWILEQVAIGVKCLRPIDVKSCGLDGLWTRSYQDHR